jgi:hypothetical protein
MQNIKLLNEKDIKKIVKDEVEKRFYSFERLLNTQKGRILELEKVLEYQDKKLRGNLK